MKAHLSSKRRAQNSSLRIRLLFVQQLTLRSRKNTRENILVIKIFLCWTARHMWTNSWKSLSISLAEFITLRRELLIRASLADPSHLWIFILRNNARPAAFSFKSTYKGLKVCNHHSLPLQWQRLISLKPLLQTHRIPATVLIQPCWQQDPSNPAHSTEMQRTTASQEIHLPREIIFSLILRQSFRLNDFRPNVTLWVFSSCLL